MKVGGKSAFISYVSPTQVNFQVPDGIGVGDGIQVELESSAGAAKTTVKAGAVSPGLLTTPVFNVGGKQYVAALHPDLRTFVGAPNLVPGAAFRPAKPGDKIIIYAVGCGPTTPESPAGQIITGIRRLSSTVQVQFGETVATADSFMEPNLVGLCRIDATVPEVANGDVSLKVTINGVPDGQSLFTTVQR